MVEREKIKLILTRIPGIENSRYALILNPPSSIPHQQTPPSSILNPQSQIVVSKLRERTALDHDRRHLKAAKVISRIFYRKAGKLKYEQ